MPAVLAAPASRQQLLEPARELARRGLHAVTYDKATEGYSWHARNSPAVAADLQAVVEQTHRVTATRRVGVLAFSEGSWVAARAAPTITVDVPGVPRGAWFTDPASHLGLRSWRPQRCCSSPAGAQAPIERNPDHVQR